MSISGEDLSWGIPTVMGAVDESGKTTTKDNTKNPVTWMQGWSPSGEEPMVCHSVGMVGNGYRFITVVLGQFPPSTSNEDANRISTQAVQELIKGGGSEGSSNDVTLGGQEQQDDPGCQSLSRTMKSFCDFSHRSIVFPGHPKRDTK